LLPGKIRDKLMVAADEAVDIVDLLRSPCCRACRGIILLLTLLIVALVTLIPDSTALLAWRALPDFESSKILPGLFTLATGVAYQPGDDWSFECIKQRCPAESFFCLLDAECRRYVIALSVGVNGSGDGCSHELTRENVCGTRCSRAVLEYSACLESEGSDCTYATGGEPVVVHRSALSDGEMENISSLAREQRDAPGNHKNRTFGVGGITTGHVVTWLTPYIYRHDALVGRLRSLAENSVAKGRWHVRKGALAGLNPTPPGFAARCCPAPANRADNHGSHERDPRPRSGHTQHAVRGIARIWWWLCDWIGLALGRRLDPHDGHHAACLRRLWRRRAPALYQLLRGPGAARTGRCRGLSVSPSAPCHDGDGT
jgi:hypothetical protein